MPLSGEAKRAYNKRRYDARNPGASERRAELDRLNSKLRRIDSSDEALPLRTAPAAWPPTSGAAERVRVEPMRGEWAERASEEEAQRMLPFARQIQERVRVLTALFLNNPRMLGRHRASCLSAREHDGDVFEDDHDDGDGAGHEALVAARGSGLLCDATYERRDGLRLLLDAAHFDADPPHDTDTPVERSPAAAAGPDGGVLDNSDDGEPCGSVEPSDVDDAAIDAIAEAHAATKAIALLDRAEAAARRDSSDAGGPPEDDMSEDNDKGCDSGDDSDDGGGDSGDDRGSARDRRELIIAIVRNGVLPQLAQPALQLKDTVAVHVKGVEELRKRRVFVRWPSGIICEPRQWTAAVMYIIRGLVVVERMRRAYNELDAALTARQGHQGHAKTAKKRARRPRNMNVTWFDLTSALGLALRRACCEEPSREDMVGISRRTWASGAKCMLSPTHWLQFLAKESHGDFVALARAMPCDTSAPLDVSALLRLARSARIGGEQHVCSFAIVLAAIDKSTGGPELLARTSRDRALELDVRKPADVGVQSYGEVSLVMCNLGGLNVCELRKLANMKAQSPPLQPTHVDANASDCVLRA